MLAMELKPEHRFQTVSDMRDAVKTLQAREAREVLKEEKHQKKPTEKQEKVLEIKEESRSGKALIYIVLISLIVFGGYLYLTINGDGYDGNMQGYQGEETSEVDMQNQSKSDNGAEIQRQREEERQRELEMQREEEKRVREQESEKNKKITEPVSASKSEFFSCEDWDIRYRPYIIGCQSTRIGEIQACLGLIRHNEINETNKFDYRTQKALINIEVDMSKGITVEIYNRVIINCGLKERAINTENSGSVVKLENDANEKSEEIYDVVENSPAFPGGMEGWNDYLRKNLKYPTQARRMTIEGTVIVTFVVNADGSIQDVEILRGIGGGCDEEALRVVSNAPKWTPGQSRGGPVRVRMRLPIRFSLG
jgi:TonB family protein